MISPDAIATKANNAYRRYLKFWVQDEEGDFFPLRIPANLELNKNDLAATIRAVDRLRDKSKEKRGWGYTVHWKQVRLRELGNNATPDRITIDTRDDLLRLADRVDDFANTSMSVERLRRDLPGLSDWLKANIRSIAAMAESTDGLIAVTEHFIRHPWPDCFARQFPVSVDTKFIERHQAILRQWLEILLPASAINVNENSFPARFGLRDGQQHRAIRLLDRDLLGELPLSFDELSLPLRSLATLPIRNATAIIVENRLNLFTLPAMARGIGIEGEGKAVTRLEKLKWLHDNRIVYWGDIDVDGFHILSALRNLFPHTESVMMDRATLEEHRGYVIDGNGRSVNVKSNLTEEEAATFQICQQKNIRLEQERVFQSYAEAILSRIQDPRSGY